MSRSLVVVKRTGHSEMLVQSKYFQRSGPRLGSSLQNLSSTVVLLVLPVVLLLLPLLFPLPRDLLPFWLPLVPLLMGLVLSPTAGAVGVFGMLGVTDDSVV